MCGIAGELTWGDVTPDPAAVDAMAASMRRRGPDAGGSWQIDTDRLSAVLGHRRLKVIDLSDHSAQPLVDAELGLVAVFNGCIYNYRDLREELGAMGYRFFSSGDTEVLTKGWHAWGPELLPRLAGMFAFCIVERDTGRAVIARDRLGIKPLYVNERPGRLRFASTLPALLAGGGVSGDIDPVALHHYMTFHSVVPAPRTLLAEVRRVPPASLWMIDEDGHREETTWWSLEFGSGAASPDTSGWTDRDWRDAVLDALRRAVRRRRVADVPVGVLLSGGVDSSLVTGLLAEAGQSDLQTFSIGFEDHGGIEGDEFTYSDLVAAEFGTDHHQIRIPTPDIVPALHDAVQAMSEPMVSHDVVAFYLLSREVAKHLKVVQSGQGADEVFAGYRWYPPMQHAAGTGVEEYRGAFFDRDNRDMAGIVAPEHLAEGDPSLEFVTRHFAYPGANRPLDRALRIDTQVMLVDDPVKRVDNMTMAWGLEARVPFLDHDLVELAARCPGHLKLAQGGKGVLKEAARLVVPSEVIDRPKGYFPVPALTHIEGPLLELCTEVLGSPEARARGLFREEAVRDLLAHPNEELTPLRGNKLWQVTLVELWLQTHGA
ncbi:MAG: N-acetylglutaminylglutamine amidotransferase [Microthrixaceae bacterium]|nr:N-acetylglutaminylglutamine amidotransferase [Microthrixaceae bacterium]